MSATESGEHGRQTDTQPAPSDHHEAGRYDAVVHFHGIGEQRRNEEMSRIVDALDVHSFRARERGDDSTGILMKIKPRFEESRDERLGDVTYINVTQQVDSKAGKQYSAVRFYETYWAPLTAGGSPTREVLSWLFKRALTPIRMLLSSWRSRQRLHRASLYSLWRSGKNLEWADERDLQRVLYEYNEFEKPGARRLFPKGSFNDFANFIKTRYKGSRVDAGERLVKLARRWKSNFIKHELAVLLVLFSFLVIVLWGLIALVGLLLIVLDLISDSALPQWLGDMGAQGVADSLKATWGNAFLVLVTLLTALGATRFISRYVGDVQFWASYSETDTKHHNRRQILEHGAAMLNHVLQDAKCNRVIVLAHSLGTTIAMECLLELGRYNRTRHRAAPMLKPVPLEKISHFVTMGSPIDKIHYFFESHRTPYHRYVRIFDDVRGDIGEVPFTKNRKPYIHWINLWDRADIVSGPLDSPSNATLTRLKVDNVEISSYPFPAPGASHSAYFGEPRVISWIYEIIFQNRYSFQDAPRDGRGRPDLDFALIGPGKGRAVTRWIQMAMLALPYWFLLMVLMIIAKIEPHWIIAVLAIMIVTSGMVGAGLALNDNARKKFY